MRTPDGANQNLRGNRSENESLAVTFHDHGGKEPDQTKSEQFDALLETR